MWAFHQPVRVSVIYYDTNKPFGYKITLTTIIIPTYIKEDLCMYLSVCNVSLHSYTEKNNFQAWFPNILVNIEQK